MASETPFSPGDFVVYPTHGVGRVTGLEAQEIAGMSLDVLVVAFEQSRMTMRVPLAKAKASGLRGLSTRKAMDSALSILGQRSRGRRTMWSRRAQEYETKLNSGDPVAIAEVVRDLHRDGGQAEQSFSERQMYESALERLACELAAVEKIDLDAATQKLEKLLKAA